MGEHGYHTGYTAKGWAPGNPGTVNGRRRELTGPAYDEHESTPPTNKIYSGDYAANFADFLADKPDDQPFCFWYGAHEPHRQYEYGSGAEKGGKSIDEIDEVYKIWPDNEVVRNDLLDYGFEIEHFDRHVEKMLDLLEEKGELENTLVIVTSDNGMPFPRGKGQEYYYSNHLPLAVMWRNSITSPGRTVEDMVSFIDFAPTLLDVAGLSHKASGMQPITGTSLTDIFESEKADIVNDQRDHVLIGKERHDVGRPGDKGYPIRGIFKGEHLYLRNFESDRWPAGNPETGYLNCDGSPTKTEILKLRKYPEQRQYWEWAFGKRPAEELYNIARDPACIENLADREDCQAIKKELQEQLFRELEQQGDPRILNTEDNPLDENPPANKKNRDFYHRFMNGEPLKPGWINETDVENI